MIGYSMLGRVIAVALAVGAATPIVEAQDWRGRGFQQQDDEVRRVGRRGRDDGDQESASDEAHERNAEREAQREAERQQREQERADEQQARQAEQQQREEARMYEQQQRQAEQQQREESRMYEQQQREAARQQRQAEQQQREAERQAEQQQREAMRGMEQQQRQAEQQQREMQRAAEMQQRQAEMEQRAYQREQRQAEQLRQPPIEAEQAREQQRRARDGRGGREAGWAEQERAREQAAQDQYRAEQQRPSATPAREELRRVEQERYQVERGGDRERYQDYREGREGRGGRDRDVAGEAQPQWRDRDQRRDAEQWDDPRRRWSADPRQVAIPREGARLSDRERRTFYEQQRQYADRYGRDWERRVDSQQRHIESLRHQRGEQYRYQQRYWQRHRDYRSRWNSYRWNFDRDPFFWSAPTYRYYRGDRWYSVNRYAIDVLQQAIRIGYEEGYYAGEADRYDGWRGGWRDNFAYRDGTLGYQGWYVSEGEYRYYFREGFRRGYEDAYYRRWRYGRRYQSGFSILPNELDLILRFELRR